MDIQHLDLTEVQNKNDDNSAWVCDIQTGICGPVSSDQPTTEPIQIDFLNRKNESEGTE